MLSAPPAQLSVSVLYVKLSNYENKGPRGCTVNIFFLIMLLFSFSPYNTSMFSPVRPRVDDIDLALWEDKKQAEDRRTDLPGGN